MQPGADFDPERPDFVGNGASTPHAARRTVERGKNAVPGRLDFVAAKARQVAPYGGVVIIEEIAPAVVTKRECGILRRGRSSSATPSPRPSVTKRDSELANLLC
jgi:hypothetical protein